MNTPNLGNTTDESIRLNPDTRRTLEAYVDRHYKTELDAIYQITPQKLSDEQLVEIAEEDRSLREVLGSTNPSNSRRESLVDYANKYHRQALFTLYHKMPENLKDSELAQLASTENPDYIAIFGVPETPTTAFSALQRHKHLKELYPQIDVYGFSNEIYEKLTIADDPEKVLGPANNAAKIRLRLKGESHIAKSNGYTSRRPYNPRIVHSIPRGRGSVEGSFKTYHGQSKGH